MLLNVSLIIVFGVAIIWLFNWAPWSKADYFEGKVSVQYKEWESAMGGHGYCFYLWFKAVGHYHVTASYTDKDGKPIEIKKGYIIEQIHIQTEEAQVLKYIDIDDGPKLLSVTITKDFEDHGGIQESHTLRMG